MGNDKASIEGEAIWQFKLLVVVIPEFSAGKIFESHQVSREDLTR